MADAESITLSDRDLARFWSKVNKDGPIIRPELGPCWVWTAGISTRGYGKFRLDDKHVTAHRVAFLIAHGRWPDPCGCHRCDYPPCVKAEADALGPAHIFEGTNAENTADAAAKGRMASGDRQGLRLHPERAARGDRNGSRLHPEMLVRGEAQHKAKLTEENVREIRRMRAGGAKCARLAREFGVDWSTVDALLRGSTWRHVV